MKDIIFQKNVKHHPGSGENQNVWAIKRMRRDGNMVLVEWAGGSPEFTYKWSGRYTASFSS